MTKKSLCQTPSPPRIPVFYTLTKIHKPVRTGRPIISGYEGPTEKLSAFVDKLLQPIAKQQKSHLKIQPPSLTSSKEGVTCLNGRHEPLYKYTTTRGDPSRMQSIGLFLSKKESHPYATTRTSAKAYPTGKFLPI